MGSAANMRQAAAIVEREGAAITVLSAMSGTTNALVEIAAIAAKAGSQERVAAIIAQLGAKYSECAGELLSESKGEAFAEIERAFAFVSGVAADYSGPASERAILAQGELLTSAIFAMYLRERGLDTVLLNAPDFMRKNGEARVDTDALRRGLGSLGENKYYVTQGFICRNVNGEIDNLGRGGSDYSATLIGAAAGASEVQIWTDIDGMHNNDPREVEGTFPIRHLHYDEAAELAYFGAKILHPSTVLPCRESGIPVKLRSTMQPDAEGTAISGSEGDTHRYRAVAAKDNITVVRIHSARMLMAYGFLRKVFEIFERYETPIDMITTSEVSVSLTIDSDCRLAEIVGELKSLGTIETETGNSIICVVGKLDFTEHGRALDIMEAVREIPLKMISYGASHRSLSMLVDMKYKREVLTSLNDRLFSGHAEQ